MDDLTGKRVVLARVHHSHSPGLKANKGREGRVDIDRVAYPGAGRECLVYFDGPSTAVINRWWVKLRYLDVVDQMESRHLNLTYYQPGDLLDNGWLLLEHLGGGNWKTQCPKCRKPMTGRPNKLRERGGCRACRSASITKTLASDVRQSRKELPRQSIGDVLKNGWVVKGKIGGGLVEVECSCGNTLTGYPSCLETQKGCSKCIGTRGSARRVEKVETGEVYPSAIAAAKAAGVAAGSMSRWIRSGKSSPDGSHYRLTDKPVTVFIEQEYGRSDRSTRSC